VRSEVLTNIKNLSGLKVSSHKDFSLKMRKIRSGLIPYSTKRVYEAIWGKGSTGVVI
jgi:hypothetical protein